jgi:hypothetical protein
MNPFESFQKVLKGEMSSEEFARIAVAYLDSPEWRRKKAAMAAEDLKSWKAGRDRLLDLIDKARADGFNVETEFVPLKEGHQSIIVHIEGGWLGFPSYFGPEAVEENFADFIAHARVRREARLKSESKD